MRVAALYRKGWVTKARVDEVVMAAAASQAAERSVSARVDQLVVRAGIDGIVLKRDVEPGDLAVPTRVLMTLGDPRRIRVTATIDERDIPFLRVGQTAFLRSDAWPGQVIRGHVRELTPGGDPSQRAFRARVAIDDARELPIGMSLEVNIRIRSVDRALLVPQRAIDADAVWVVAEGRVHRRPVRTGIVGQENVQILSGLKAGEAVVVAPDGSRRQSAGEVQGGAAEMIGRLGLLFDIASKHVTQRPRQTIVAVVGVAVGVGFFLAVSALMIGSQNDFIRQLIDVAPHIIISDELRSPPPQPGVQAYRGGAVALRHYKTRNEVRGLKDWQQIVRTVNAIPGAIASPSLSGGITLRLGGRDEALQIIGIEPDIESKVSTIEENLRVGRLKDLETVQGGVIVGEELAQRMGIGVGDVVSATSSSGGVRTLRIVGLFKRGQAVLSSSAGYVLLREAQSLLGRPFIVNRIGVRLDDPYAAEPISKRIEAEYSYKAESWQERSADFLSLLITRNIVMYSVISAILLVASFGIYTAVSNSVADKRRDIAILRSIGFSLGDLQLVFILEGLALALIGVVVGWGLGWCLMEALGSVTLSIGGESQTIPLDRTPRQYAIAAGASLVAGIFAAWLPARKAAKVDPVDILRGAA